MSGIPVIYDKTDFEKIWDAVGKGLPKDESYCAERIETYGRAFLQNFADEKREPPHAIVKRLAAIGKKAEDLAELTKLPRGASALVRLHQSSARYRKMVVTTQIARNADGHVTEHERASTFLEIEAILKAVKDLTLYAKVALAEERKRIKSDPKRHAGHVARQIFVNDLAGLWVDMFDELPGSSIVRGKEDGPFIRFVLACYEPLHRQSQAIPKLKAAAARAHYRNSGIARLKRYVDQDMVKSNLKKK